MEWLDSATIGFVVVFLGTLFLIGELLVRTKGIFAILGIAIMAMYFSYHLSNDVGLWIVLIYIIGISLIVLDGKVITDGTVALFGVVLMIAGLALPSPNFLYGFFVSMAALLGGFSSLLFLKVFPPRNLWSRMTLKERLTSDKGYNSLNEQYLALVGKEGKTITPFRPTGSIEIEGKQYSATSGGQWLESGEPIVVESVDGTRIVVRKVEKE